MTHLDMTFGNVNTQERNKVMSVVESKESLQKAWEWLQWQWPPPLEPKPSQNSFFGGKISFQCDKWISFNVSVSLSLAWNPESVSQCDNSLVLCRGFAAEVSAQLRLLLVGPTLAAFGLAPLLAVLLLQGWTLTFLQGKNFPKYSWSIVLRMISKELSN